MEYHFINNCSRSLIFWTQVSYLIYVLQIAFSCSCILSFDSFSIFWRINLIFAKYNLSFVLVLGLCLRLYDLTQHHRDHLLFLLEFFACAFRLCFFFFSELPFGYGAPFCTCMCSCLKAVLGGILCTGLALHPSWQSVVPMFEVCSSYLLWFIDAVVHLGANFTLSWLLLEIGWC